jgi:hypothetical protein
MNVPWKRARDPGAALREVVQTALTLQAAALILFAPAVVVVHFTPLVVLMSATDVRWIAGFLLMLSLSIWGGGLAVFLLLGIIFLILGLVWASGGGAVPDLKRTALPGVWDREIDG